MLVTSFCARTAASQRGARGARGRNGGERGAPRRARPQVAPRNRHHLFAPARRSCQLRTAVASFWTAIDICNKWTPCPYDPTRGSGNPTYHNMITTMLMNKNKLDLREGRGKLSALHRQQGRSSIRVPSILPSPPTSWLTATHICINIRYNVSNIDTSFASAVGGCCRSLPSPQRTVRPAVGPH